MKLPVTKIFTAIQKIGRYAGYPSIFIVIAKNNENIIYNNINDIYNAFVEETKKYPLIEHIVITGNEPMLYKESLCELLLKIKGTEYNSDRFSSYFVTIETNGTISPKIVSEDKKYNYWPYLVDFYSISPESLNDIDIKNTGEYTDHMLQLKFIYSGHNCINNIKEFYKKLIISMGMSERIPEGIYRDILPIMLMPEGQPKEIFIKNCDDCIKYCIENGWIYIKPTQEF